MDVDDAEEVSVPTEWIQWAEEGHIDDENILLPASEEGEEIEHCFALKALLHGRNIDLAEVMRAQLDGKDVIRRRNPS